MLVRYVLAVVGTVSLKTFHIFSTSPIKYKEFWIGHIDSRKSGQKTELLCVSRWFREVKKIISDGSYIISRFI